MAKQRDNVSGSGGGPPPDAEQMYKDIAKALKRIERVNKAGKKAKIPTTVEEAMEQTVKTTGANTTSSEGVADETKVRDREYRIGFAMNDVEAGIANALAKGKVVSKKLRAHIDRANKRAFEDVKEGRAKAKTKKSPYEKAVEKKKRGKNGKTDG